MNLSFLPMKPEILSFNYLGGGSSKPQTLIRSLLLPILLLVRQERIPVTSILALGVKDEGTHTCK